MEERTDFHTPNLSLTTTNFTSTKYFYIVSRYFDPPTHQYTLPSLTYWQSKYKWEFFKQSLDWSYFPQSRVGMAENYQKAEARREMLPILPEHAV